MSWWPQLRSQAKFDVLAFRRNPAATFFTVVFPIIFLVIFTSLFGNEEIQVGADESVRVATFYVPGILALSVVSATFMNIGITITAKRESGVLKRVRGTPIRPAVFLAAQIVAAIAIMVFTALLVIVIGNLVFDVSLRADGIVSLLITLVIGSGAFCLLGLALTAFIPSFDAAPAITNAIVLPLYFVSDVFIVGNDTPAWMETLGNIFPVRHLAHALQESFVPSDSVPLPWNHWLVIAAWGAVGAVIALNKFRWTPWDS